MAHERLPFSGMDPDRLRFMGRASFGGYILALDILNRPEGYFRSGIYVEPLSHRYLTPDMAKPKLLQHLAVGLGHVVQYTDAITVQGHGPFEGDFDRNLDSMVIEGYESCEDILERNTFLRNHRPNPLADRLFTSRLRKTMAHLPHIYDEVILRNHTATLLAGVPISPEYP